MTDIDVLAVTMLEPEAVNIDILYFHSIYTSHIYISILCFLFDSEYLGKIF